MADLYNEQLAQQRRADFHKWLDLYSLKATPHYRVLFDKKPGVSRYPHDGTLEWATEPWHKHPANGWGKPDKMIGNIEVRYLWK